MNTHSSTECLSTWRPTLVVITCCTAGHAAPVPGSDGISRSIVRFADLNLAVPEDVAELYRRIEYAARKVCSEHDRDRDECFRRAVLSAVMKIDRPELTDFYRARRAVGSLG